MDNLKKSDESWRKLQVNLKKTKRVRRAQMSGTVIPRKSVHSQVFVGNDENNDFPKSGDGFNFIPAGKVSVHRSSIRSLMRNDETSALRKAFS
jgi:hypothetical protein